jgi:hypothetical protein
MVGLGFADVFAGTISMAFDAAVSFAAGKIGGAVIKGFCNSGVALVGLLPGRMLIAPAMINMIRSANGVSQDAIEEIMGGALGKVTAQPLGDATDAAVGFYQDEFIGDFSNGTLINP